MSTLSGSAQTNYFKAGVYEQIPYRVFVSLSPTSDKQLLNQAEWLLRSEIPNVLVHLTTNNELWTFSFDESVAPPAPHEKFNLKETSTGVFLASTLAASDSNLPTPYTPIISAVRALIYHDLIVSNSYIRFGSVIVSPSGKLLHVNPTLAPSGDLFLNAYYEQITLKKLRVCDNISTGEKILLAPSLVVAEYLENASTPLNSQYFMRSLELSAGMDFGNASRSMMNTWVRVKVENVITIWPLDLCFTGNETYRQSPDLSCFNLPDLFSEAGSLMEQVKKLSSLNQPSEPSAVKSGISQQSEPKKIISNVYPTPPEPLQTKRIDTDLSEPLVWNNTRESNMGGNTEMWDDLDEDLFGEGQEVTEADFNFFDRPELTSGESVDELDSKPEPISPPVEEMADLADIHEVEEEEDEDIVEPPTKKRISIAEVVKIKVHDLQDDQMDAKSLFTPLKFNPLIESSVDSKYTSGGRFFVKNPEDDSDVESIDGLSVDENEGDDRKTNLNRNSMERGWSEIRSARESTEQQSPGSEMQDYSGEWYNILSITRKDVPTSFVKDRSVTVMGPNYESVIDCLIQQVVWDDGTLGNVLSSSKSKFENPDSLFIKRTKHIFPNITKLSLNEVVNMTQISTNDVLSQLTMSKPEIKLENDEMPLVSLEEAKQSPLSQSSVRVSTHHTIEKDYFDQQTNQPNIKDTDNGSSFASTKPKDPDHSAGRSLSSIISDIRYCQNIKYTSIFQIPMPFLSLIRAGHVLKARISILRFWKVFGLSPINGFKNAHALTFCPSSTGMVRATKSFLDSLAGLYEGAGLGEFKLLELQSYANGIVPFSRDGLSHSVDQLVAAMKDQLPANVRRITVLFVNPYDDLNSVLNLMNVYVEFRATLQKMFNVSLTLYVVDKEMVGVKESLSMVSQYKLVRYALNLYDRLPYNEDGDTQVPEIPVQRILPAFSLAKMKPLKICFKMTKEPSLALLEGDDLLHIAYSFTDDKRWVVCCWSDQWGDLSKVEAFNLKRADGKPRPKTIEDVFVEIWDKTLILAKKLPIKWRITCAKVGHMGEDELAIWQRISSTSSQQSVGGLLFMSVNTNPSLIVSGDETIFPYGKFIFQQQQQYSKKSPAGIPVTPATPHRGGGDMESPDMHGINIATPTGNNPAADVDKGESDELIMDVKDDTYCVLWQNQSSNLLTPFASPKPVIRGFLVKPALDGTQQHRVMEVALLQCPQPFEGSLKTVLVHFRRLAALGGYIGVSQQECVLLPWHVEAVEKMVAVLRYIE